MQVDYVERFINFIENFKDDKGNKKYIEKLKQYRDVLTVEMIDVYKYDPLLAIKLINDYYNNDNSLLDKISEHLSALYNFANKIKIEIPGFARIAFGLYSPDDDLESLPPMESIGYVAMVSPIEKLKQQQKIFVILMPEIAIVDNELVLILMKLKGGLVGKVRPGDKIRFRYVYRKEDGWDEATYAIEIVDLTVLESGLDDIKETEAIDEILYKVTNKTPPDLIERLIDFLENFKDKQGKYKYREQADYTANNNMYYLLIEKDDIKEYDRMLFLVSQLNPADFEIALRLASYIFANARKIARDLSSKGIRLVQQSDGKEVVMITERLARRYNLTIQELAERFGGYVDVKEIDGRLQKVATIDFLAWAEIIAMALFKK